MRVKVSCVGAADKVVMVNAESSLQELLEAWGETGDIQWVRFGYPPQVFEVTASSAGQSLSALGIGPGEKVVVVREDAQIAKTAQPAQPAHPAQQVRLHENQISLEGIWPGKILQVHSVPDDNSCMFHAISYCTSQNLSRSQELRGVVATEIAGDPVEYSDAILGRPNHEYSGWILKRSSWGGGIELAVLSRVLKTCIMVMDVDACKFERFNEQQFDNFVMVAFNGVHYDAMEVIDETGSGRPLTVFSQKTHRADAILARALEAAARLKRHGYSFNTTRDRIRCNVCGYHFVGEREVARHAEKTGHVDFGQSSGSSQ
ncbi:LAQU0S06e05468g1_1 [Lachancea quebecensis]|uniref:Ubiquitin thioesterase OTU n=1 Tax=Lachancea quebecensis TaxID=1654605 RepID=A0A0P1KSD4_9SACH|nr:LAQU0S06e05468g1_1 [Lachancea quebecensis]